MFIIHYFFLICFNKKVQIDKFIINNLKWLDKFFISSIFYHKLIKVNNCHVVKKTFVFFGDIIFLFGFFYCVKFIQILTSTMYMKSFFNLLFSNIIYESPYFFILNKLSGFSVHSGKQSYFNILSIFRLFFKEPINLIHRLDKNTTGCLVFSKCSYFSQLFSKIFFLGKVEKIYYCLIDGLFFGSIIISILLLRDGRIFKNFSKKFVSLLLIKAVHCFKNNTLVSIFLYTGKKHQIRVCCSYFNYMIVGENKYILNYSRFKYKKLFLHARSVKFFIICDMHCYIQASFDYYFCFVVFFML